MDKFDRTRLRKLTSHNEGPCVSVYLETHPTGKAGEQDAILLKNLLRDAETKLSGHWMRAPEARDLLKQAGELPRDPSFWRNRGQGLVVFIASNVFDAYRFATPFTEQVAVSNRFRVRPLLPLLEPHPSFCLLTVSENHVALYAIDEDAIEKLEVPGLPASLREVLNVVSADRGSQVHTAMHGVTGKQAAVFHGHGGQADTMREDQLAYCGEIDKAVSAYLGDSRRPLLLAGVERLVDLYRRKSTYKYLLPGTLGGNHDRDSEYELRTSAWRIAQPLLTSEATKVAGRYAELVGTSRVNDEPRDVVRAAMQGRVESLLYDAKAEVFGECDPGGGSIRVTGNREDDDLVDFAAVETLRCGGTIHAMTELDVPTNSPLAAILRY